MQRSEGTRYITRYITLVVRFAPPVPPVGRGCAPYASRLILVR